MNFGDLSENQKHRLEERTSLFINICGMQAQKALEVSDTGVSTRKLYKILANVLLDWHGLSLANPAKYSFKGAGDLVWVPHRFGALGLVCSKLDYDSAIELKHGLFPDIIELFTSREFAKYGAVISSHGDQRYIKFPEFIDYEILEKGPVEPQERHYWSVLASIYATKKMPDATLDALASCRSQTLYLHSVWVQLVHWKRYMGIALDAIRNGAWDSQATTISGLFGEAHTCALQIGKKTRFLEDIANHSHAVRSKSVKTEFRGDVPCIECVVSGRMLDVGQENAAHVISLITDLDYICRGVERLMRGSVQPIDFEELGQCIGRIAALIGSAESDVVNARLWHTLFIGKAGRQISSLAFGLMEASFDWIGKKLNWRFERPTPHYQAFVKKMYPLAVDHFAKGY